MREPHLQITYRHGRPLAAYYYLPRRSGDEVHHSRQAVSGLVVDYAVDGRPIGIEIAAPSRVTLEAFNELLRELGQPPIARQEFAPLTAA